MPALIISFIITTISLIGVFKVLNGDNGQFILYLMSFVPILLFSLVIS